jgi:hypothetical protein
VIAELAGDFPNPEDEKAQKIRSDDIITRR